MEDIAGKLYSVGFENLLFGHNHKTNTEKEEMEYQKRLQDFAEKVRKQMKKKEDK